MGRFGNILQPVLAFFWGDYQPAGTLGDLFYEYFGLDEDTLGTDVVEAFTDPSLDERALPASICL